MKYLNRLGIEDIIIINELLIFDRDIFIVYNVTRAIYQYQEKLYLIE